MPEDEAIPMTGHTGVLSDIDRVIAAHRTANVDPPLEIRLTADQLGRIRREVAVDFDLVPGALVLGIPVVLVDNIEDSTPRRPQSFRSNRMPQDQAAPANTIPRAGSIGLVKVEGVVGEAIRVGQWLDGDGFKDFEHAFVLYQRGSSPDLCTVIEAEAGGVRLSSLSEYAGRQVLWLPCPEQCVTKMLVAAITYVGVPYSFTDYAAIAAHHLRLPVSGLMEHVINRSHHVICSQLAAACADKAGWSLLTGQEWPGFVTPGRLAKEAPADAVLQLIQ